MLTEDRIRQIVQNCISEAVIVEKSLDSFSSVSRAKQNAQDALYGMKGTDTFDRLSKRLGFMDDSNLSVGDDGKSEFMSDKFAQGRKHASEVFHAHPEQITKDMAEWLASAKNGTRRKYDPWDRRMQTFADRLGITYLYDERANPPESAFIRKPAGPDSPGLLPYGVRFSNVDQYGNTLTGLDRYDMSGFDLENTDHWVTHKIDNKDVRRKSGYSEKKWESLSKEEKMAIKEKISRAVQYEKAIERYVDAAFGMHLDVSTGAAMTLGNAKVPKDTLIINFTSAMMCPAWEVCLVKYACYARTAERLYTNSYEKNNRNNMMWQLASTKNGEKLMDAMLNLVRSYVDASVMNAIFGAVKECIKKGVGIGVGYVNNTEYLGQMVLERGVESVFDSDEAMDIYNRHLETDAIRKIRLNENGDFVNQNLVNHINVLAGELKEKYGIVTSAYTCRNLNFERIKNININASRPEIKNADRYFWAVPEDVYNLYAETYKGADTLCMAVGDRLYSQPYTASNDGEESGKTKARTIEEGVITPEIKPLYNYDMSDTDAAYKRVMEDDPSGKYYYKCPCGRSLMDENGNEVKITCYNCRLCYESRQELPNNAELYVLVKVHGSDKKEFNASNTLKNLSAIGGSGEGYNQRLDALIASRNEAAEPRPTMDADDIFYQEDSEPDPYGGLDQVVKNGVWTMGTALEKYRH